MSNLNLKNRAMKLKKDIPVIFTASKDKEMPLLPKIIVVIIIVYALSPIDLIPDFVPVLGYIDDIIILPALIGLAIKFIPRDIMERAREKVSDEKIKKKWYYSLFVIFIWIIMLGIVVLLLNII